MSFKTSYKLRIYQNSVINCWTLTNWLTWCYFSNIEQRVGINSSCMRCATKKSCKWTATEWSAIDRLTRRREMVLICSLFSVHPTLEDHQIGYMWDSTIFTTFGLSCLHIFNSWWYAVIASGHNHSKLSVSWWLRVEIDWQMP